MSTKSALKLILLVFSSIALSSVFYLFAALPLRLVRNEFGRLAFLLVSMASIASLFYFSVGWALNFSMLVAAVGIYSEMEAKKWPLFYSVFTSVFATFFTALISIGVVAKLKSTSIAALLKSELQPAMETMKAMYPGVGIEQVIFYLPAGVIVMLLLALFVALKFDSSPYKKKHRLEWRMFSLPVPLIWVLIASLAGAYFVRGPWSFMFTNILVVVLAAYFFQGVAIMQFMLRHFTVAPFWRALLYVIFFTQLLPLVCFLGISDLWVDYRKRLTKFKTTLIGR